MISQKLIFFSLIEVIRLDIIVSKKNIIINNNKYIGYYNKKKVLNPVITLKNFYENNL